MSVAHITKIIEVAKLPPKHGQWAEFCVQERLSKDAVFHQRKKLGLPMRKSK